MFFASPVLPRANLAQKMRPAPPDFKSRRQLLPRNYARRCGGRKGRCAPQQSGVRRGDVVFPDVLVSMSQNVNLSFVRQLVCGAEFGNASMPAGTCIQVGLFHPCTEYGHVGPVMTLDGGQSLGAR